jgi:hypothetical protein
MGAAGTRQRIIEANRYNPSDQINPWRGTKEIDGMIRSHKQAGDLVLTSTGMKEVNQDGWH